MEGGRRKEQKEGMREKDGRKKERRNKRGEVTDKPATDAYERGNREFGIALDTLMRRTDALGYNSETRRRVKWGKIFADKECGSISGNLSTGNHDEFI